MSYNRNGNGNAGHDPISARDRARAELRARNAVPAPALHGAAGEATTARLAVSRPSRSRATVAVVASLGLVGAGLFGIAQASSTPQAVSFFSASDVPTVKADPDRNSVELGMRFTSSVAGSVTAVRFWKGAQDTGTHVGNLWSSSGFKLASVTFSKETASGWQQASFGAPVKLSAGSVYTVSYFAPKGGYGVTEGYFSSAHTSGPLTAPSRRNGVFKYGSASAFPTSTYNASNYYVDVVFQPSAPVTTAAFASPTASTAPAATVAATATATAAPIVTAPQTTTAPAPTATQSTSTPSTGFPDATNTGYRNAPGYSGTLTKWTGGTITSNSTYSFVDFAGADVGSPSSPVSNVTFIGCRFKATSVEGMLVGLWGTKIKFSYSSFEPGAAAPPVAYSASYQYGIEADGSYNTFVHGLTVDHSDFWGFGNAIDVTGSSQAYPQVFTNNWIHDASDNGGSYHTDGIGSLSGAGTGSYVTIDHNTIESPGNTNGIAFQAGSYSHFTVTNNLLGGFGYTVAILGNATYVTFTDNTFSKRIPAEWGPVYPADFWSTTGSTWARNTFSDGTTWGP